MTPKEIETVATTIPADNGAVIFVPLNKLKKSPRNARKVPHSPAHIGALAASIRAKGMLQNLVVERETGTDGKPTGFYLVTIGEGRRLAQLLRAKRKEIGKTEAIRCVLDTANDPLEISLDENVTREAMHPADQFEAFQALAATGKGPEEIAARFGVTAAVVRQRLKLASVSPTLIDLYRHDEMSLDQLMAFTVSDDTAAQEAAWLGQPDWQREPDAIRRTLTAAHVEADDDRVLFAGLDAYKAAGGGVLRDLFDEEHEGYLTDPALLDRLVAERLQAEAASIRAEGWKWVEIVRNLDYETLHGFGRVHPERVPLPSEQQEELDQLTAEYDALIGEHGDDPEPEIADQIDALSARIDTLFDGADAAWRPDDIAIAGAVLSVGHGGTVRIERGLLRAGDRKARAAVEGGQPGESETAGEAVASPLSAKLIEDLTAERTAALRAMLGDDETVALAAIAHALALPLFYPHAFDAESCLDLGLKSRDLRASAGGIGESGAAILLRTRHAAWEKRLPEDAAGLFGWLLVQNAATVISLIAFCAAMSVDAVQSKQDRPNCPRLAQSGELATALGLDMAVWWEPTKARYLGRVSKALILEAVTEGVSASAAENLSKLKKDELIARAEERLRGKGWLPAILRPLPKAAPTIPVYAETVAAEPGEPEPADVEPDAMPMAAE